MTVRTRKNVWDLPRNADGWSDTLLWYARGVARLKSRPIADPASWRSYAAIHGVHPQLWTHWGYLTQNEELPPQPVIDRYWLQCQHGTWYFLPWHRGYLAALENSVRDAIKNLPGHAPAPADWALPYWNYFKPGQNDLPPEFGSPDWPDGTGDNPLYVTQRWGPYGDGTVSIPLDAVDLNAMAEPEFSGDGLAGGSVGFGGPDTHQFEHGGRKHGAIESQPHDAVHGLTGGAEDSPAPAWWPGPHLPGLMSSPPTAGLDPIFYLHHANIDRLWAVWIASGAGRANPIDPNWLAGPAALGQRKFSMPTPDGVGWDYTPADMVDTTALGYDYDDLDAAGAPVAGGPRSLSDEQGTMPMGKTVEIFGASEKGTPVVGGDVDASVRLDPGVRDEVVAARVQRAADDQRVLLNLENVTGLSDATVFKVYLNVPTDDDPANHPELLAGSIGLFGVRQASDAEDEHGGQGLDYVLDVTRIVNDLSLRGGFDADHVAVRIVPLRPVAAESEISIGRISLAVQGD